MRHTDDSGNVICYSYRALKNDKWAVVTAYTDGVVQVTGSYGNWGHKYAFDIKDIRAVLLGEFGMVGYLSILMGTEYDAEATRIACERIIVDGCDTECADKVHHSIYWPPKSPTELCFLTFALSKEDAVRFKYALQHRPSKALQNFILELWPDIRDQIATELPDQVDLCY